MPCSLWAPDPKGCHLHCCLHDWHLPVQWEAPFAQLHTMVLSAPSSGAPSPEKEAHESQPPSFSPCPYAKCTVDSLPRAFPSPISLPSPLLTSL